VQTGNAGGMLSVNYGLRDGKELNESESLTHYCRFLYETGALDKNGIKIKEQILEK
jgi:hypothetical protein